MKKKRGAYESFAVMKSFFTSSTPSAYSGLFLSIFKTHSSIKYFLCILQLQLPWVLAIDTPH